MTVETLAQALEREHHEIDGGIEEFVAARADGRPQAEPLRNALAALRRHIYLEEEFLFPPLNKSGLMAPIFVMLREHGEIWQTMDAVDAELDSDPDSGPSDELCRKLLAQQEAHNTKEEAIVYPQADEVLDAAAGAKFHELLETGQLPPGWVCARA